MKELVYLKNVVTLKLDKNKCIGCELCTIVCPHTVFKIKEKKAVIVNRDACMECGACAMNCSVQAIEVSAGVGCAAAIIFGKTNSKDFACNVPTCDCNPVNCC